MLFWIGLKDLNVGKSYCNSKQLYHRQYLVVFGTQIWINTSMQLVGTYTVICTSSQLHLLCVLHISELSDIDSIRTADIV